MTPFPLPRDEQYRSCKAALFSELRVRSYKNFYEDFEDYNTLHSTFFLLKKEDIIFYKTINCLVFFLYIRICSLIQKNTVNR